MASILMPRDQQQQSLAAVQADLGTTMSLHLYKTDIPINDTLTKADMDAIECDFDGYAAFPLTSMFGLPVFLESLNAWVCQAFLQITATGGTTPNTVYGYYLTNSAGASLVGVERFIAPQGVSAAGEAVNVLATIGFNPAPV